VNRADRAYERTTPLLADPPAAARPHRHSRTPRPVFAALAAHRSALIAVAAVSAAAVTGIILLALLNPPRHTSAAPGKVKPETSAGHPGSTMIQTANRASAPATSMPTPTPASGSQGLSPGSLISIESLSPCCASFSISHDGKDEVVISHVTPGSAQTARADASWIVLQGLANSACISFESADARGEYLRQHDDEVLLEPDSGSTSFAQDATFCPRPGNLGHGSSLASYNHPTKYLRNYNGLVFVSNDGGPNPWDTTNQWHHDTTWEIVRPWG
jgi:Alpha-L-arabinofuranosidase B (ABFB) domain